MELPMLQLVKRCEDRLRDIFNDCARPIEGFSMKPHMSLGQHLQELEFLEDRFWQTFIPKIDEYSFPAKFRNTQVFWQACIEQDINPVHILTLLSDEKYSLSKQPRNLLSFNSTQHKGLLGHDCSEAEFIGVWDDIFSTALNMTTPYSIDPEILDLRVRCPHSRLMDHAYTEAYFECFVVHSRHFEDCLRRWAIDLPRRDPRGQLEFATTVLNRIARAGLNSKNGVHEGIHQERITHCMEVAFDAFSSLDLSESRSLPRGEFRDWISVNYPHPEDRLQIIKKTFDLKNTSLAVDAFFSMLLSPEVAVEALLTVSPDTAFEIVGKALMQSISADSGRSVKSLPELIDLVERYRVCLLKHGLGELKGHPCLDHLCVNLAATDYFSAKGYIRVKPVMTLAVFDSAFVTRFEGDHAASDRVLELNEIDTLIDVLIRLDHLPLLIDAFETWCGVKFAPDCFSPVSFVYAIKRCVEREVFDINRLASSERRVLRLQEIGITAEQLQDSRAFKAHQEDFLGRDLGL